jgi:uncharacterized membrane protein (Fun14 family)
VDTIQLYIHVDIDCLYDMSIDSINSTAATIGDGFFGGLLFGYAIKKVVKLNHVCLDIIQGLSSLGLSSIIENTKS